MMISLESLKTILINCKDLLVDKNGNVVKLEDLIKTIKQDLDRLEKLGKAIGILKDKIEFEDLGEMQSGNMYRGYFNDCLDNEEVNSIKEVLGYEK